MPNKQEKQRRKELRSENLKMQQNEFENNLPMDIENFKNLIVFLNGLLAKNGCDHTYKLTKEYLVKIEQKNIENVLKWLEDNGGICDCKVLGHVLDEFLNSPFGSQFYELDIDL
jgi:hypothetical protein